MRLAVAVVALVGCAGAPPPPAATATQAPPAAHDPLAERGAALFDAAVHGDRLRLKTLVDWTRWRSFEAWAGARSESDARQALSQLEAQPQPGDAYVDAAVERLQARLAQAASGPLPPREAPGAHNAALAKLRAGPPAGSSPSLARLTTLVAESLSDAHAVTFDGAGRVTLVFVDGELAALLEAS
jgi:hypothetical protein